MQPLRKESWELFRRPFITPESQALGRASELARVHAHRVYAISKTKWPKEKDSGLIEEDGRESFIMFAINLRRVCDIWKKYKEYKWPLVQMYESKNPGIQVNRSLSYVVDVGTHLTRFKFHWTITSNEETIVQDAAISSDRRSLQISVSDVMVAGLAMLENLSKEHFEEITFQKANSNL